VLCYEHHVEMKIGRAQLELRDESAERPETSYFLLSPLRVYLKCPWRAP